MSNSVSFQIAYDGSALREGSISVRSLAPALMGLADLVDEAAKTSFGKTAQVELDIRATGQGSFVVDFDLIQTVNELLTSSDYEALRWILGVLGVSNVPTAVKGTHKGYLWLKKKLASSPAVKIEPATPPADQPHDELKTRFVKITFSDGTQYESYEDAIRLTKNPAADRALAKVLEPLEQPGIESFHAGEDVSSKENRDDDNTITRLEAIQIRNPTASFVETVIDHTVERALTIETPSFKENVMWRVSDGASSYLVKMLDDAFVEQVQNGDVSLNARDTLVVQLRSHQYRTEAGLKTDYEVIKVERHIPPGPSPQLKLSM